MRPAHIRDPSSALTAHELAAWRGMLEVHARVTSRLDAEMQAAHGITLSAYEVLMFLGDAPGHRLRMAEIAARALLSRSGCTRLVDRLQRRGYVTRCAADDDGRGLYAEITAGGLALASEARETHLEGIRRAFLSHLTTTDQIALADIWDRFRAGSSTPSSAAGIPQARP